MEQEEHIQVVRFSGRWEDLGIWNTLTEEMSEPVIGQAMYNENYEYFNVVNELHVPILYMGLKNIIVSASPERILVSDKEQSSYIKPFVNSIEQRTVFA